jgi:CBS domain-containing protein
MSLRARDVMQPHVVTVTPDTTLAEVADMLICRRISDVPVVEGNAIIGSSRDTAWHRLLHRSSDPRPRGAARIMWDNDCGCVPVRDFAGHLVGMITDRDICMAAYLLKRVTRTARRRWIHDHADGHSLASCFSSIPIAMPYRGAERPGVPALSGGQ